MSVTPQFAGQYYRNTSNRDIWKSNSTTPGDWSKQSRGGETFGLYTNGDSGATGKIVITDSTCIPGYNIQNEPNITEFQFPLLTTIDSANLQNGFLTLFSLYALVKIDLPVLTTVANAIFVKDDPLLTTFNAPMLSSVGSSFQLDDNTTLPSLNFPSLITVGGNYFSAYSCHALTTLNIPLYVPTNGNTHDFHDCALNQTSIDMILARLVANPAYVSGIVQLDGGTNSPPSSVGPGSDYDILTTRGVAVTVNP